MRKVKFQNFRRIDDTGRHGWCDDGEQGWFHCMSIESTEVDGGAVHAPVAVIEKMNGELTTREVSRVTFLEPFEALKG